jgi:hypothetical protein
MDTQASIEAGFLAYCAANGVTAYGTRHTGDEPDQKVIVQYQHGGSAGHCATTTTTHTGEKEDDWFNGVVIFEVHTERALAEASPVSGFASLHDYRVAQVKALMLRGSLNGTVIGKTALVLDYHRIAVLSSTAEDHAVDGNAFDVSTLNYAVQLQIKADAWPTP